MSLAARVAVALTAATIVAGCGCGTAHEIDAAVDGAPDAADGDGGPDAGRDGDVDSEIVFDDASIDGDAGCEVFAGRYRRCDPMCPFPCTATTGRCEPTLGVCNPEISFGTSRLGDSCDLDLFHGGVNCWTGMPCAAGLPLGTGGMPAPATCSIDMATGAPNPYCGPCVTPEFCMASAGAGLPSFSCIWSDGTAVVTGPPAIACAESPDSREPFCGGSCGLVDCAATGLGGGCVAVSDSRGFGVCAASPYRCDEADASETAHRLTMCRTLFGLGQDCVCLVPAPQTGGTRMGFVVLPDVCRAYRSSFPSNAECTDSSFSPIP